MCQKYSFESFGDGVKVTGYIGTEKHLNIPATIEGWNVYCIGEHAFQGNKFLVSVSFPETLEIIDREAFRGCPNLEKASLPETIKYLGYQAFADCPKLIR